jgi:hypothetical protein
VRLLPRRRRAGGPDLHQPVKIISCKGCHDYVSFTGSAPAFCGIVGQLTRGPDGKPVACNHVGGAVADDTCTTCHGPGKSFATAATTTR